MKYTLIFVAFLASAFLLVLVRDDSPLGVSINEPDYYIINATSTRVTCGTATTTLLAAQTGRTSARFVNTGTSTVWICKSAGLCSATSGFPLAASATAIGAAGYIIPESFEQADGYKDQYSCNAPLISTVNVISSQ